MEEIFKDIKDYEGLYQVSNLGRIKSVEHYVNSNTGQRLVKEHLIAKVKDKKGYYRVSLWKDNKDKHYLVHRLVAETFIPNPENLPTVNHKDENPSNNCVDNLEWCTNHYNLHYGNCITKISTTLGKPVLQYTLDMVFIKEYPSAAEAFRQTGISQGNINKCCNGKYRYKSAGGYIWKFK